MTARVGESWLSKEVLPHIGCAAGHLESRDVHGRLKTLSEKYSGTVREKQQKKLEISMEGRAALEEKYKALTEKDTREIRHLSSVNAIGMQNDFERTLAELSARESDILTTENYRQDNVDALKSRFLSEQGAATDSFDIYTNKMAATYRLMAEQIEEKYARSDRPTEYYTAEDGSIQELTKDKEMEMLNRAYENHSRFMAVSTQIWSDMQNRKFGKERNAFDGGVKETAYRAFKAAIRPDNLHKLNAATGSFNKIKLDFSISAKNRAMLNMIWDSFAVNR